MSPYFASFHLHQTPGARVPDVTFRLSASIHVIFGRQSGWLLAEIDFIHLSARVFLFRCSSTRCARGHFCESPSLIVCSASLSNVLLSGMIPSALQVLTEWATFVGNPEATSPRRNGHFMFNQSFLQAVHGSRACTHGITRIPVSLPPHLSAANSSIIPRDQANHQQTTS
jgi:hypothetical protein